MKLTKAQAKKYSLIKWDFLRKAGKTHSDLREWLKLHHPIIFEFPNHSKCAYCLLYIGGERCKGCPLVKLWKGTCFQSYTPYDKWACAKTVKTRKKYAEIVYQDIKRS